MSADKEEDFSTPPPELSSLDISGVDLRVPSAPGEDATEKAGYASALLEDWKLQRDLRRLRAFGAMVAFVAGLIVVFVVLYAGMSTASDAWNERLAYSRPQPGERLKYVIAFFTFKAAALGGALTAGLLLIRAANMLTGGNDPDENVKLTPTDDAGAVG